MKAIISRKRVPDAPLRHRGPMKPAGRAGGPPENANPSSLVTVLTNWGALVALWAPVYLVLLDRLPHGFASRSEALEWTLVTVGVLGSASVLYRAWRDTQDPAWRAAHGLARRTRPNAPGHETPNASNRGA